MAFWSVNHLRGNVRCLAPRSLFALFEVTLRHQKVVQTLTGQFERCAVRLITLRPFAQVEAGE